MFKRRYDIWQKLNNHAEPIREEQQGLGDVERNKEVNKKAR